MTVKEIKAGRSAKTSNETGRIINVLGHEMSPEDIITMDWLLDNVVGDIPAIDELDESARAIYLFLAPASGIKSIFFGIYKMIISSNI